MADETGMGAGARGALGAGAAVIVVLLGYLGWSLSQPAPVAEAPAADAVAVDAAQPAEAEAEEPAAEDTAQIAAPAAEAPPVPPSFDVVRVEPDGSATVAGSAAADAKVSLRVDGAEVAQAQADGQGKFAALFTLAASDVPRLLSLVAILPDGTEIAAVETVALAPTKPVAVAATEEPAAPAAPAAVLLTDEGAQVLQSASDVPPEVLANVSVDTITYTPEGAVQLGGRGQGAGFARIYLDDAEKALVDIGADGLWAATLPDVAPGIYTLRVDQIGADGKVTWRFETPFKRETLEALAAASAPAAAEPAAPEPVAEPEAPAEPETAAIEPAAEAEAVAAGTEAVAETAPAVESAPVESVAAEPAAVESVPTEAVTAEPAPPPAPVTITVQPGFTLWGIAEQSLGDGVAYVQVFEANKDKIRDPDLIYPGQVFTIPKAE